MQIKIKQGKNKTNCTFKMFTKMFTHFKDRIKTVYWKYKKKD